MCEENCSIDSVLHRMQSTLACRICLDLLSNPLTTKCGHTFCKECLDRLHISRKASYPCPLCMTPITKRSLNQNAKISTLVSAVRNVISSIKQDCGVQEVNKNVGSTSETISEEQSLEEAPIRRTTRKNKPVSFYMDETFANSKKRISKKVKDKGDVCDNTNNVCEENKITDISLKDSSDTVNGHIKEFVIPALPNKPALGKVEQWLSKNQSVECKEECSDNIEDLQATQIFSENNESEVTSKENPVSTNECNMWTSQCSTVIFSYEEFLTSNKDISEKPGSSKEFEEEHIKEETNSMVSEKENEKSCSKVKQTEGKRGSKRILYEPNKIDNAKRTNVKKSNKTLQEADLHNKKTETDYANVNLLSFANKPSSKSEVSLKHTEDASSKDGHISNDATVHNKHKQQPNSKGHNIRFASSLKVPSSAQAKPSRLLSRGRNRKSPGWSRIEGARRDLRSKQMSLNITGGEQKLLSSDISKLNSSKINIESSQESVIIIDDQTQTEKTGERSVAQKTKKLSTRCDSFLKSKTFNNSCGKNINISLHSELKTTAKLKELEVKLTKICESNKDNIIRSDKGIAHLSIATNNVHNIKQPNASTIQAVDENKTLNSVLVEETLVKSKNTVEINNESSQNVENSSSFKRKDKELPKANLNRSKLSRRNYASSNITNEINVEVDKIEKNLSNSLTSNICKEDIDVNSKIVYDVNNESKCNETQKENLRESPEIEVVQSKNLFTEQKTIEMENCDEPLKAAVSFVKKGSFDTKSNIPNSSCHHSIPCELFHVLVKYSKYLISESQVTSCSNYMERECEKFKIVNQEEGGLASASENTVIPESCVDDYEQNVAIILPDQVPGTHFKYIENLDYKTRNLKEAINEISEDCNLDHKSVESRVVHNLECKKQKHSHMIELSNTAVDDKPNDLISAETKNKFSVEDVISKKCEEISEKQMANSFSKDETQSHMKSLLVKYDRSQIEKDLFSENEEEVPESLSLLSTQQPSKSLSADSPIAFKRNRRIKRIESPNSLSDDELPELIKPQKKRAKIFSSSSSTSAKPHFENNPKIDSEEMRDFERYDENVWHYFKDNLQEGESCVNKEKEMTLTVEINKEDTPYVNNADDTSDDDVIPGTEEVLKNIDNDLFVKEKEEEKEIFSLEKSGKIMTQGNQTVDLFSQDSVKTISTVCGLNSSVKELFNKCNTSLHKAQKILNNPQLSQDKVKDESITCENMKTNVQSNEDEKKGEEIEEEKTENESHLSMLSTESPVLCTQQKKNMETEVEVLRNRIKALEKEMEQKKVQLSYSVKSSCKTNIESCTNPIDEIDQNNTLKTSDEPGKDSDADSEELFTTFPADTKEKHLALKNGKSQTNFSRSFFKKLKPITLICTGLNQSEISLIHNFSSTLCGSDSKVVNTWSEDVTHVIVNTDEEGMAQRTLKYLLGVVNGSWIVSNSWVNDSLNSKILLPEDEYEALDCTGAPGPNRGRKSKNKLFSQFQFILIPPFQDISAEQLIELIKKCGGSVVKDFCEENPGPKLFIIDAEDPNLEKNGFTGNKPSRAMVGYDWVIECIGNYAHVSLSNYLVGIPTMKQIIASEIPESLIHETQEI